MIHIGQRTGDLTDGIMVFSGCKVACLQKLHLAGIGHGGGNDLHRMDIPEGPLGQHDVHGGLALTQGFRSLTGAAEQTAFGLVHRGGHHAAQSLVDPDCRAGDHRVTDGIHPAVDHIHAVAVGMLCKQLCIVRAGGQRFSQDPLAQFSGNHRIAPLHIITSILSHPDRKYNLTFFVPVDIMQKTEVFL